jgi:DDE superfamily endonuclease
LLCVGLTSAGRDATSDLRFGTHESLELMRYYFENNIILCRLPSHTSHKLQPCDVGVFGPLKTAYREQVEQLYRGGANTVGKQHFTFTAEHVVWRSPLGTSSSAGLRRDCTLSILIGSSRKSRGRRSMRSFLKLLIRPQTNIRKMTCCPLQRPGRASHICAPKLNRTLGRTQAGHLYILLRLPTYPLWDPQATQVTGEEHQQKD